MICSECCSIVPDGNFCPKCGAPLKSDSPIEQDFSSFDYENPPVGSAGSSYVAGGSYATSNSYSAGGSYGTSNPYDASGSYTADSSYSTNSPYAASAPSASYSAGNPYGAGNPTAPYAPDSYTTSNSAPYSPYTTTASTTAGSYPSGYQKAPNAAFVLAIVGLILSLTGVLALPGIVCCLIALALNSKYNRKGFVNERKTPTFVMGLIGLLLGILVSIFIAAMLVFAVAATENTDIDVESYLEEILDGDADLSDESKVPSIIHVEGRDADDADDSDDSDGMFDDFDEDDGGDAVGASDTGSSGTHGGVAGRISGDDDADDAASGAAAGAPGAGANSELGDSQQAFVGKWKLTKMVSDGEDRADILEVMEGIGMKTSLILEDDGVAKLSVFDEENYSGTWVAESPTSATLTFEGESVSITLDDGVLTLYDNGDDAMYFEKE